MKSSGELREVVYSRLNVVELYSNILKTYAESINQHCQLTRVSTDKQKYVDKMQADLNHLADFLSGLEDKLPEFVEAAMEYEGQKVFEAEGKNPQGISTTGGL